MWWGRFSRPARSVASALLRGDGEPLLEHGLGPFDAQYLDGIGHPVAADHGDDALAAQDAHDQYSEERVDVGEALVAPARPLECEQLVGVPCRQSPAPEVGRGCEIGIHKCS